MAITDAQKVDLLFKKVGFGVTKTDTSTNKSPSNESVSSPLLIRGDGLYSQSDAITNVALLPTSNVAVAGTTVVAVYRDSLSSAVQLTNDGTAAANRTWKTNLTDWIGPEFGAGYSVKVYTGAALSATTASTGTSLPIDGSGNNDSWYFDYQAGILNFADTNVPSTLAAQVWVVGARYTGAKGIATLPSLAVTGNITSANGNVVLTNGNIYAANHYGAFIGSHTGSLTGTASTANVSLYQKLLSTNVNANLSVPLYDTTTGNAQAYTAGNIVYNPFTNTIYIGAIVTNGGTIGSTGGYGNATTFSELRAVNFSSPNVLITGGYISSLSNITATTGNLASLYVGTLHVTNGNVTTGYFGSLNTANAVISGGYISALSNITATTGNAASWYATTINATAGNINTGYFGSLNTANAVITGGSINATTIGATTKSTGGFTTLTATGVTTLTNGTDATSTSSGALQVTGGVGILGNLWVGGNIYAANIIATVQNQITVQDPLLYLQATGNLTQFDYDIGFFSDYTAPYYAHTGLARSIASNTWTFFSNVKSEPSGTTINWNDAGLFYDKVKAGELILANARVIGGGLTANTGTFQVYGDGSVSGNLFVGGNLTSGNVSVSMTTGTVMGNVGNFNNLYGIFYGTVAGASGSANVSQYQALTNTTANQTFFIPMYDKATGNAAAYTNTNVNVNPTTGTISANLFSGSLASSNVTISGGYISALSNITATTGNAASWYATTIHATSGNVTTLYATNFSSGNIWFTNSTSGTVATANVALYDNVTALGLLTPSTQTFYLKFGNISTTGNTINAVSANLSFNPNTGVLTSNVFSGNITSSNVTITGGPYVSGTYGQFTNFNSGNITGTFNGSVNGTVPTANVSLYDSVTALGLLTPSQAFYLQFSNVSTSGNTISGVSANLSFNPNTGVLSANVFSGNVTSGNITATTGNAASWYATTINATAGNVTTLQATNFSSGNIWFTNSTSGTVATANVSLYQRLATTNVNANLSVPLYDVTTGNAAAYTSGNITYNPFTNTIYIGAIVTNGGTIGSTGGYGNATVFSELRAVNFSSPNVVITGGYISSLSNITTTTGNAASWYATTINATSGNITTLYATNFSSGNITGTFNGSVNGTVPTANVALYDNVTALGLLTPSQPLYLKFGNLSTSGNTINAVSANLSFNPNTGILSANVFSGNVTSSNVYFTGTTAGTVSTANVAISNYTATSSVNATFYPGFYNILGGNAVPFVNSTLNYNPSTGVLAATTFSGSGASLTNLPAAGIVGTVSTANVSLYANVTALGALTPSQAFYLSFGNLSTSGNTISAVSANLSFNPNTGVLTSNVFSGVGTFTTANTSSTFIASGNIVAASATESTSTTTGALVLPNGGVGIFGNVTAGKAATFNSSKTAGMDFFVRGKTDNTLIWARPGASYDQVVIGNSATTSTLVTGAKLIINSTDAMMVPVGTTAQRPSSTGGTDTAGMVRYNSTSNTLEFYNGASWSATSSAFTVVTDTQVNGDGTTVAFTNALFASATTNGLIISINGVVQIPSLAYSLTGSTITFTEAPASGDVIDIRVLTTTSTITAIASANGFMTVSADNNGVYIATGTASATVFNWFDTTGGFVSNIANVSVASANTLTTVDTITNSVYRSAKYVIQVTNGASYQVSEALVIQNGTTATVAEYGVVRTGSNLGVISATVSGATTLVQFIAANATNNVRIRKEYMMI